MGDTFAYLMHSCYKNTPEGRAEMERRRRYEEEAKRRYEEEKKSRLKRYEGRLNQTVEVKMPSSWGVLREKMSLREAIEKGCRDEQIDFGNER